MENIYFQPNKENSEFLAKLEKLDEYTIPQILDRIVDHFRNLPELEDTLIKLGIKTDSLKDEEELDDDIRVEESYWVDGRPKRLRHIKGDSPSPVLIKDWYDNGQLKMECINNSAYGNIKDGDIIWEKKVYWENGQIMKHEKEVKNHLFYSMLWYKNGKLSYDKQKNLHYDSKGNEIDSNTWEKLIKEQNIFNQHYNAVTN